MARPYLPSIFSRWKPDHIHEISSLLSSTDPEIVGVRNRLAQPSKSKWKRKSNHKPNSVDPLKARDSGSISKKAKTKNNRFYSRNSYSRDGEIAGGGVYDLVRKSVHALRVGLRNSSDSTSTPDSGSGSGSGSGSYLDSESGPGSSTGSSSGPDPALDWRGWVQYVRTNEEPANEAAFRNSLVLPHYSRVTKKIGAIARPYIPNLCYINATIQALAATRFPHYILRPNQLNIVSPGLDITPATDHLRTAFRTINKWYDTGFTGCLNTRAATGRIHLTPSPFDLALDQPPFTAANGYTPMCDVKEFFEELSARLANEYTQESSIFHGIPPTAHSPAWVDYPNPTMGQQATKRACLLCGYTYIEQETKVWMGSLYKPHWDANPTGLHTVSFTDTLDHFTRVALVHTEACISCNLIEFYNIHRRARRHLRRIGRTEKEKDGSISEGTTARIAEVERRMGEMERGLNRRLTSQQIPTDENGRLPGIYLRSEAATPRSPRADTKAISHLPDTLILGYDIINPSSLRKNRTHVELQPIVDFSPWTADMSTGAHNTDALQPLRSKDSKFNKGIEYECRAVIYHVGMTTNSGHYITERLPWIPRPDDVTKGTDSKQPYEWWLCNESFTDMFTSDQPFRSACGAKEQEVMVVFERIIDPADKIAIPAIKADGDFDVLKFQREYHFSEYGIPGSEGSVVMINNEQALLDQLLDKIKKAAEEGHIASLVTKFEKTGLRSSKRVWVDDDEDGNMVIPPEETRPLKRARVSYHKAGGRALRSTGHVDPEVEEQRRKAMEKLQNQSLARYPKAIADPEQKRKWRMGGSHGGDYLIPPPLPTIQAYIDISGESKSLEPTSTIDITTPPVLSKDDYGPAPPVPSKNDYKKHRKIRFADLEELSEKMKDKLPIEEDDTDQGPPKNLARKLKVKSLSNITQNEGWDHLSTVN
ncbi:hypothetical protein TWF730_009667 [Orbilia blumenaviensis]|uniref:ubiquitinyl hydrolase 1 n=1 Tax=Orbilia blumenaviensis TaxID=1796055 RepID=A0AAV9UUY7_9PEZI